MSLLMSRSLFLIAISYLIFSCSNDSKSEPVPLQTKLFTEVPFQETSVHLGNDIEESYDFNFINYPYIYIGAGISAGDINNDGDGTFNLSYLPNEAKIATILDFEIFDINDDGFKDVIGVGNLYDAEVETV